MHLSTEQKQTHRHREQTCVCQGWGGGLGRDELGVWNQQMQTIIHSMDKQQGPVVQQRELQSVRNHNGKEYEKVVYTHTHTHTHTHTLNHFAVWQKLTQHCKYTIFEF